MASYAMETTIVPTSRMNRRVALHNSAFTTKFSALASENAFQCLLNATAKLTAHWDEANCTTTSVSCSSSQFTYQDSGICIPLFWICDNDPDCEHGEDERESLCKSVTDQKLLVNPNKTSISIQSQGKLK